MKTILTVIGMACLWSIGRAESADGDKAAIDAWWKSFDGPRRQLLGGNQTDYGPLIADLRRAAAAIAGANSADAEKKKEQTVFAASAAILALAREWRFYAEYTNIAGGLSPSMLKQVCPLRLDENEPWLALAAKYAGRGTESDGLRAESVAKPTKEAIKLPAAYYLGGWVDVMVNCGKPGDALKIAELAEPLIATATLVIPRERLHVNLKDNTLRKYMAGAKLQDGDMLQVSTLAAMVDLRGFQVRAVSLINPNVNTEALSTSAKAMQERLDAIMERELQRIRTVATSGRGRGGNSDDDDDDLPKPNYSRGTALNMGPPSGAGGGRPAIVPGLGRPSYDFSRGAGTEGNRPSIVPGLRPPSSSSPAPAQAEPKR